MIQKLALTLFLLVAIFCFAESDDGGHWELGINESCRNILQQICQNEKDRCKSTYDERLDEINKEPNFYDYVLEYFAQQQYEDLL